jgi:hypothetical protein
MRHRHLHAAAAIAVVLLGLLAAATARANVPSHEDGLIAFQRNDDASGEIWVLDPTAAAPQASALRVTSGPQPEARPTFGPTVDNAQWLLAYQRYAGGNWDIWGRTTRGKAGEAPSFDAPAALVDGPGNQTEPAYSRVLQGTPLLAYVSDQTGRREIWLQDTAGTLTQLTDDGAGYAHPDFAGRYRPLPDADGDGLPDAYRIGLAFESTRGGTRAIWALDIEVDAGGTFVAKHDLRPVASGPGPLTDPSWQVTNDFDFADNSIDSRLNDIVFATPQSGTTYLDYVEEPWVGDGQPETTVTPPVPFANPAAIVRHPLTGDPGGDGDPVWAPNGDQVAFERTTAGDSDIWTVQADGTGARRLTSGAAQDLHPSWQPGSESSVDKVGGHTNPGPVDRSHGDGGKGDSGKGDSKDSGSQPRVSPGLRIAGVRWHNRKVRLAGRTAAGVGQRLRVTFSCGSGGARRSARLVFSRSGRFGTTLKTKQRCRRARRGLVAVAYGGDTRHLPDRVTRRVRRR